MPVSNVCISKNSLYIVRVRSGQKLGISTQEMAHGIGGIKSNDGFYGSLTGMNI